MATVNDNYRNAVVGKVTAVSTNYYRQDGYRLVTLLCEEPMANITVRVWVCNPDDAEMLVDRMVVVYDCEVYPMPL